MGLITWMVAGPMNCEYAQQRPTGFQSRLPFSEALRPARLLAESGRREEAELVIDRASLRSFEEREGSEVASAAPLKVQLS